MEEYDFSDNNRMTEELQRLKNRAYAVGNFVKEQSMDTGFKDGIKTTSYCYEYDNLVWSGWDGDAEQYRQLKVDDEIVFKFYDCYGTGKVSISDKALIKVLFLRYLDQLK